MRKIKYFTLSLTTFVFFIGCSTSNGPQGPQGKTGPQGAPAAGLQDVVSFPMTLSPSTVLPSLTPPPGTPQYFSHQFAAYDSNYTYMLSVYVNKGTAAWFKLPYIGAYVAGPPSDELYASIGNDSIKIWYVSPSPWPDSVMTAQVFIIPQQKKI